MDSIWDKPVSHGQLLKRIWKNLEAGSSQRKHPFHSCVFATVSDSAPNTRTVILRRFWKAPARIAFHAHIGSPKISHIKENSNVSWLFYDDSKKFQVRIKGVADVHSNDEIADEQWVKTAPFGRRCYMGESPTKQSEKPTHGMPKEIVNLDPTIEESEVGRENFVVVSSTIRSIDCVELDVTGHRRALFLWDGNGEMETKWLTP